MDLPIDFIIKTFTDFCVCYFKDIRHDSSAPPHYYITVPVSDDSFILFCIITSQVENKLWYYKKKNEKALESLVRIDPNHLPFLTKISVIDCNMAELISRDEIVDIIDSKLDPPIKVITRNIPDELKDKIISAIKNSPIVKPIIKKMIKDI